VGLVGLAPAAGVTDRRAALWLLAAFVLIYCGTAKGVLEQVDDVAMLRVTQSIVREASVAVAPDTPGASPGVDGRWYARYGLGQSLLAIPLYLLGSLLPPTVRTENVFDPHGFVTATPLAFAVTGVGSLTTAGAVALLYLTCRALGYSQTGSVATAGTLGLATFAWFYARTFMSEPSSMLGALLAFYALVRYAARPRSMWLWVSGAAAGIMLLLRIANAALLPPLGLWLLWLVWRQCRLWSRLRALAAWLLPVFASLTAIAVYNSVRFGSAFETGYAEQAQAFDTPLYVGLYGLLFSSGKSLFLYAPILVAAVVGWFRLHRAHSTVAWPIAALVLMYVGFYSRYDWWYGGGPWGPRFMTVILPFVCIPLAVVIDHPLSTWKRLALATLAALSVSVQLLSVLVPYLPYEAVMAQDDANYDRLLFHPAYSPLLVHARALLRQTYPPDLAFTYYPSAWLAAAQAAAVALGAACLLVLCVRLVTARPRRA
jgi:hypothetical protein